MAVCWFILAECLEEFGDFAIYIYAFGYQLARHCWARQVASFFLTIKSCLFHSKYKLAGGQEERADSLTDPRQPSRGTHTGLWPMTFWFGSPFLMGWWHQESYSQRQIPQTHMVLSRVLVSSVLQKSPWEALFSAKVAVTHGIRVICNIPKCFIFVLLMENEAA